MFFFLIFTLPGKSFPFVNSQPQVNSLVFYKLNTDASQLTMGLLHPDKPPVKLKIP